MSSTIEEGIVDMVSQRFLVLEKAIDEELQADKELISDYETVVDKFIDGYIDYESLDDAMTELEINQELDDAILGKEIDEQDNFELITNFCDNDGELSEINKILDSEIDPLVMELDD